MAGESAGGNLATVVAMIARDRGLQLPTFQLLVYPVTNRDFTTPSMLDSDDAVPLSTAMLPWAWNLYLEKDEQAQEPYASPLVAPSLAGMPPAMVVLAEIDPLRTDGDLLERALRAAGVSAERRVYDGVTHEFFGMAMVVSDAAKALKQAAAGLKRGLAERSMASAR